MPTLRNYDLFISHSWDYNEDYHRLVEFLKAAPNFLWRNFSVPDHDPLDGGSATKLHAELERQIRNVHAVLILAGMYVNHREWIQREIDMAIGLRKPMIGIRPWASERIPDVLQRSCVAIVGWNTNSIVDAIRAHAL